MLERKAKDLDNEPIKVDSEQQDKISASLEKRIGEIKEQTETCVNGMKDMFNASLLKDFKEENADRLIAKWSKYHHHTRKALLIRKGYLVRRNGELIDMYSDIVEHSRECIIDGWQTHLWKLKISIDTFCKRWMTIFLCSVAKENPGSGSSVSAIKDTALKVGKHLISELEHLQDLLIFEITKLVEGMVTRLCKIYSERKDGVELVGGALKSEFRDIDLRKRVLRAVLQRLKLVQANFEEELDKFKENVSNILTTATLQNRDQIPEAGSNAGIAFHFSREVEKLFED